MVQNSKKTAKPKKKKGNTANKTKATYKPRKPGRPSKLSEETIKNFSDAIAIGSSYELACRHAQISEPVVYHWLRLGRAEALHIDEGGKKRTGNALYLEFLKAVEDAEAEAGIKYQKVVNNAAAIDPNWAWKMLKARFGSGYADTANITNTNITIPENMPTEYLDRIIAGENPINVLAEYHSQLEGAGDKAKTDKAK
jgi:transposase